MNVFLYELSKEYLHNKIALIMDGAGWRESKNLKVPKNIVIFYFPQYSSGLNPVERLWLYIRDRIVCHVKIDNKQISCNKIFMNCRFQII